jgi:pilus assembly protein CpaB
MKRNHRVFYLFLIALGLGTAAAWLANDWILQRSVVTAEAGTDTVPVVVAALEIPFGGKIEAAHLRAVSMPRSILPSGTFSSLDEVEGKIAKQGMLAGEMVLSGRVVDHLGGSTLAAVINPEMRAVTVRVNDVAGVAGFLLPGNRVDVLATRKQDRRAVTETLLQDINVLAVDQTATTDNSGPVIVRAVTLEVSPDQAEDLVKAKEEGTIQLTLRNPVDDTLVMEEILPAVEKKVSNVHQASSVTVIRGTQVEQAKVRL